MSEQEKDYGVKRDGTPKKKPGSKPGHKGTIPYSKNPRPEQIARTGSYVPYVPRPIPMGAQHIILQDPVSIGISLPDPHDPAIGVDMNPSEFIGKIGEFIKEKAAPQDLYLVEGDVSSIRERAWYKQTRIVWATSHDHAHRKFTEYFTKEVGGVVVGKILSSKAIN